MKRPKTTNTIKTTKTMNSSRKKLSKEKNKSSSVEEKFGFNDLDDYISNKKSRAINIPEFINSLFSKKIYREIYFAWCKDCNEPQSVESGKYFREELLARNNKDLESFNFKSMRVGTKFLKSFCNNLPSVQLKRIELQDNLINDDNIINLKTLITSKQLIYLNLASNQISSEGLKIIQNDIANSQFLKYLNLGVIEGSSRVNNFSYDGGIVLARILLKNKSIETLILQENSLGEDAGDKIGTALIENETLRKLVISNNKIKNKGARSIIENGNNLISIDLSDNDISPEVCYELKILIEHNQHLKEIIWSGNYVGFKGVNFIIDSIKLATKLKSLSLRNTAIGKKGIKVLAEGLTNNNFLEILDIGSNAIVYESFVYLCDCLNTNKIRIFRCRNNILGDDSMKYFADTILIKTSTSCLNNFDFSSCKIYDQGLIFVLNGLISNNKINWINLRDNYFSHEIDFVILDFLEKNTYLTHIDLTRNRFSFQCLQKVNKIVKRNRNIQSNKEPNKLLVELYSLKYENTKLNELREALKNLENYNAKLKLNKIDLRQDYEIFRKENNEKIKQKKKLIEKRTKEYNSKLIELDNKKKDLDRKKQENAKRLKELEDKYDKLLKEKSDAEQLNEKLKKDIENIQSDWTKKIVELNDNIKNDQKIHDDLNKKITEMEIKIEQTEEQIKEFEKHNPDLVKAIREEEIKNLEEEKNKSNVSINKDEEKKEEKKEAKKIVFKEEKKEETTKSLKKEKDIKKEKKDVTNRKLSKKKTKKF